MTTTKEVVLKIKADVAKVKGTQEAMDFFDAVKKANDKSNELAKNSQTALDKMTRGWEKLKQTVQGATQAMGKAGSGGGGSSGGLGVSGGQFIGAGIGAVIAGELKSALPALWGQSLHGGPLMRGSLPLLESLHDMVTGRSQRETMEEWRMQDFDRVLNHSRNEFQTNLSTVQGRQNLETLMTPWNASLRQQLGLKQEQGKAFTPWTTQLEEGRAGLQGRLDNEYKKQDEILKNWTNYKKQVGFDLGGLEKHMPDAMHNALGYALHGAGNDNRQKELNESLENQIRLSKAIGMQLEKQKTTYDQIKTNLEGQLGIAKQILAQKAAERGASVNAFASKNMFEQQMLIQAAQRFRNGEGISEEEKAALMSTPEGARLVQRSLGSAAIESGRYGQFLQAVGRPDERGLGLAQQQADLINRGLSFIGAKAPTVDVYVELDEDYLAGKIQDQLREVVRRIEVVMQRQVDNLKQQADLADRRKREQNISGGGGGRQ